MHCTECVNTFFFYLKTGCNLRSIRGIAYPLFLSSGQGGGGGGTQTRNLCTFGKEPNINELYLDIWLFTNSYLCQFIEIVHKIINWYMKKPNNYLSVLYKHIIQVENKNVGLKGGGGTFIALPPPQSKKC